MAAAEDGVLVESWQRVVDEVACEPELLGSDGPGATVGVVDDETCGPASGVGLGYSDGVYCFEVGGLVAGAGVAVIGVIPPLWRCLRLPIVEALRAG